jgi:hypothetical protein
MTKNDTLESFKDEELQDIIGRAQALLKQRDEDRKAKALEEARTLLASVGLSLKDVAAGRPTKNGKGPIYHAGHQYQHPTNKALSWNGKGQKPNWLRELEAQGGKVVEAA